MIQREDLVVPFFAKFMMILLFDIVCFVLFGFNVVICGPNVAV